MGQPMTFLLNYQLPHILQILLATIRTECFSLIDWRRFHPPFYLGSNNERCKQAIAIAGHGDDPQDVRLGHHH